MSNDDLRERLTERLNTTQVTPEGDIERSESKFDRHDRHNFLYNCAVCQGNVSAIVASVLAEVSPMLANWEVERASAAAAIAELDDKAAQAYDDRDEAIGRAEQAEARADALTALLNDPDRLAGHLRRLRQIEAAADADEERDRLADGGDL